MKRLALILLLAGCGDMSAGAIASHGGLDVQPCEGTTCDYRVKIQTMINWSYDTYQQSGRLELAKQVLPDCKDMTVVKETKIHLGMDGAFLPKDQYILDVKCSE
jgi:hypothetical protein